MNEPFQLVEGLAELEEECTPLGSDAFSQETASSHDEIPEMLMIAIQLDGFRGSLLTEFFSMAVQ